MRVLARAKPPMSVSSSSTTVVKVFRWEWVSWLNRMSSVLPVSGACP
jgi:hypothetical protein